jgi:integrase
VASKRGIYKRGGIYWLRTDPITKRPKSTKSKTMRGAQEFLTEREQRAANPSYAASHQATLGEWANRMIREKAHTRSPETVRFYQPKIGHLLRFFGEDAPLSDITPGTVDDYLAQRREEGAHHYTISREFTALRQILKPAKRARVYAEDLDTLFPDGFGHGYKPRETVLMPEDEEALRGLLTAEQWACVAFILATSARFGELTRAQPEDWDPDKSLCLLRGTKTKASLRTVPVVSLVRHYMDEAAPHLPFDWAKMSQQLPLICERNELPRITPNDLRRTLATRLIEAGVDPYLVAKITGHVSLKMLREVYDRATPEKTLAAIEAQIAVEEGR